jgi:hypothetical protein
MTPGTPLVRFRLGRLSRGTGHRGKTSPEGWQVAGIECCSAFDVARDGRLRLDAGWSGDQSMRSTSPPWVWVALVLALLMIGYVVAPPVLIRQAATLWGWG